MESLYVEANEESLYRRRERLSIQYALKLKSMPKHPAHKSIFQPKYSTKFADKPSAIPTFGIGINKLLQDIPSRYVRYCDKETLNPQQTNFKTFPLLN